MAKHGDESAQGTGWWRDRSFWRDITKNTISGLLVAGIIYVVGLAAGYFDSPELVQITLAMVGLGGLMLCLLVVMLLPLIGPEKFEKRAFRYSFNIVLVGSGIIMMFGVAYALLTRDWSEPPPGPRPLLPILPLDTE